ncbi:hypothetical protein TrCOL_g11027 [Triparma columacea]|uniref:Uncharacterized protein n=1 Tax=Triparma columacea TaxID=722753 RepID=A0A9W7L905_9STRA|nr:hypothetical protein TrCOL_g11027 [Triparma columacea]
MVTADSTLAVFNRRNALSSIGSAGAAAGVAILLSPQLAFAVDDETADMVARIAAKAEAANAADREKDANAAAKKAKDKDGAGNLVLGVAGGGLALSVPFFLPNLIRLAKKATGNGNPNM